MLNCRLTSFVFCVVVSTFVFSLSATCFAQLTPLQFAQRNDVSNEIQVDPQQSELIRQLEQSCDEACQLQMQQALAGMDNESLQQFESLGADSQQQFQEFLSADLRETMELEMLGQQVLDSTQMNRFNQLWMQTLGLDALTSGPTSRQLNMSPIQIEQIQNFQNNANELINACVGNPNISDSQKNTFITNINNILIDQSVSILNNIQIENFVVNTGEPFDFDPDNDLDAGPDGDTLGGGGIDSIAVDDTGNQLGQTPTEQIAGLQRAEASTAAAQNQGSNTRGEVAARTSNNRAVSNVRTATTNNRNTSSRNRNSARNVPRNSARRSARNGNARGQTRNSRRQGSASRSTPRSVGR